ncbi:putative peroxisomal membrane protein PMP47A [Peziza echinospora]|nr:putative peroxisomal membrane protein PMP47A [Peziza echinospora]
MSDNVLHAISGAGGGVLSMLLTYPLITLSTRSQVESKRAHSTVLDATRRIIQREGISGLYAGLDSAVFGISVTNFVYYYWYEWSRTTFEAAGRRAGNPHHRKLTTLQSILAGALAGSATVLITNPIWVVNTRMTARKQAHEDEVQYSSDSEYASGSEGLPTLQDPTGKRSLRAAKPSTWACIQGIIRDEGFGAFFAGVLPALVLVINPILQYTLFEQLKNMLERRKRAGASPTDAFYLGALAKLVATSLTYPYITVKSRMHVAAKGTKNHTMMETIQKIIREEGWGGLYRGIGTKVTQSVITAAFLFAFKDALFAMAVIVRNKANVAKLAKLKLIANK